MAALGTAIVPTPPTPLVALELLGNLIGAPIGDALIPASGGGSIIVPNPFPTTGLAYPGWWYAEP